MRGPVLAVDGGNTKTEAVVAAPDGSILGHGRGGNGDIYGAGDPERALATIVATVDDAVAAAGVERGSIGSAVFSLAGADWPEDFDLLESELLRRLELPAPPLVVNDAIGGIRAGTRDWVGAAVVCGTFNAVGARGPDGRVFHLGFWPDRTGGFDLANEALKAVYREGLELGPPTALTPALLDLFACDDALGLMHAFTRRGSDLGLEGLQRIAPILLDVADTGDAVARGIVEQAGSWLGREARVSAARVGLSLEGAPIVLSGGVLQHPSLVLAAAIMAALPGAVAVRPTVPPVVGALLIAFDRVGADCDAHALADELAAVRG